jgi:hypothetical protein
MPLIRRHICGNLKATLSHHSFCALNLSIHPCSTLDLPRYTTEEVLRARLLTAITYGLGGILNG